jgi:hypothetical protein
MRVAEGRLCSLCRGFNRRARARRGFFREWRELLMRMTRIFYVDGIAQDRIYPAAKAAPKLAKPRLRGVLIVAEGRLRRLCRGFNRRAQSRRGFFREWRELLMRMDANILC